MKNRPFLKAAPVVSILLLQQACSFTKPGSAHGGPTVSGDTILCTPEQALAAGAGQGGEAQIGRFATRAPTPGTSTGVPAAPQRLRAADAQDKVLNAPRITSYQVGRYVDPSDPHLMHEAHVVYRIEEDASWLIEPVQAR